MKRTVLRTRRLNLLLGVTVACAACAREEMPPGSLMIIGDHLNWSGLNPMIGEATDARFVNMVDAYDPGLRARLRGIDPDLRESYTK